MLESFSAEYLFAFKKLRGQKLANFIQIQETVGILRSKRSRDWKKEWEKLKQNTGSRYGLEKGVAHQKQLAQWVKKDF